MRRDQVPGVLACFVAGLVSVAVHVAIPQVSALLVAIILGLVVANTVGVPAIVQGGVEIAGRRILRIGIVFLGLQLSLADVAGLGPAVIAVVVAVVVGGLFATMGWGALLGVPFTRRLLIAGGFSICGAAAVAGVAGVVDAEEEDVATGIALVVLFGTLMIPIAPAVGALVGLDDAGRAVFTGASIHEVAQVVAAAGIIGPGALAAAVLVKLARVLMLAPVLVGIGIWQRRGAREAGGPQGAVVPLFVACFVGAVLIRSFIDLPPWLLNAATETGTLLLATAMFALGLGVRVRALRAVGGSTLVLGALSTATVLSIALGGVLLAGV
ncbi:MAG: putative sulfate exporter family transporter [Ornithinibacter sp.]